MIAETKNTETFAFEYGSPPLIGSFARIREMLPAIQLDDQLRGMANKVRNESCKRNLTSEARAVETMVSE